MPPQEPTILARVSWRRWLSAHRHFGAQSWLKDVTLEEVEGEWVLVTATRFSADWITGALRPGAASRPRRRPASSDRPGCPRSEPPARPADAGDRRHRGRSSLDHPS